METRWSVDDVGSGVELVGGDDGGQFHGPNATQTATSHEEPPEIPDVFYGGQQEQEEEEEEERKSSRRRERRKIAALFWRGKKAKKEKNE